MAPGVIALVAMALLAAILVIAALEVIDRRWGTRLWGGNTTHETKPRR